MVYICESCLTAIYQCAIALAPHIQQFEYFQSQYGALPCWGHHKNDNWPKKVQLITESYLRALEQCAIASHHTSSSSNIRAAVSVSVWSSSSQLSVVGTSKQAIHSSGLPDSRIAAHCAARADGISAATCAWQWRAAQLARSAKNVKKPQTWCDCMGLHELPRESPRRSNS